MKTRQFFQTAAMIAVSGYATLVVMNLAVLMLLSAPAAEHRGLYQLDATRGHAHVPGFKGEVRTTASFPVAINSHGYRDREWSFAAPHRVLVVGDSFTFGEPLPFDATIVGKLQKLGAKKTVRIYNAGVSGYGLAHILATVRKECPVVRPARVLYLYYFNDTSWDALKADSTTVVDDWLVPSFERSDPTHRLSRAEIRERIAETLERRRFSFAGLFKLSHLLDFLERRGLMPKTGVEPKKTSTDSVLLSDDTEIYPPELSVEAAKILRAMAAAAEQCGAAFTMAVLPTDWEARQSLKEPTTERLLALVADDGMDILDLRKQADPERVLRLAQDNHYNPEAAAWAAGLISAHLDDAPKY